MDTQTIQRPIRAGDIVKTTNQTNNVIVYIILSVTIDHDKIRILISPVQDENSSEKLTITIDSDGTIIDDKPELYQIEYLSGQNPGTVYVAAMNLRGKRAPKPESATVVNATSCQRKDNKNRRDFSPMTQIDGGYKGYWNFESYWQSGKVWEGVSHNVSKAWWKKQNTPKRKYPPGKGKQVLHARFDHIDEDLEYVPSRKRVYVPEYYNMIKDREQTQYWRRKVLEGNDIVVYDMDGPRSEEGDPVTLTVNLDMLKDKIEYTKFPFGHGYVVAATFAGIIPDQYI
jgi:hypothetical protein